MTYEIDMAHEADISELIREQLLADCGGELEDEDEWYEAWTPWDELPEEEDDGPYCPEPEHEEDW